jgi:nickel/cobalt transporter (NiCoT) family protein
VLLGTAVLAYTFGLRHAIDADHIAAIDNVTRKLMQDGQRPIPVGFFFSLGHSTIVIIASVAIALATGALENPSLRFRAVGGVIGTLVSASFLFLVATANLFILRSVYRSFREVRHGSAYAEEDLNKLLEQRGLLGRFFRPIFRLVTRSWHMYPLGVLFGLGFDTATEIGLLENFSSPSVPRPSNLVDYGVSRTVYGWHVVDRYDGRRCDAWGLWLGFP